MLGPDNEISKNKETHQIERMKKKKGAGSLGNETTLFGLATYRALVEYQRAHNITPASGWFGPDCHVACTYNHMYDHTYEDNGLIYEHDLS